MRRLFGVIGGRDLRLRHGFPGKQTGMPYFGNRLRIAGLGLRPGVTAPVVGPRTIDQLDGSLRALDVRLEADVLARLDEIFPGPGGPAPEAYAW